MYEIRHSSKNKKRFKKLIAKLSKDKRNSIRNILQNNPYPRPTLGNELCKVEKKGPYYCIEVTGGDRILYLIDNQDPKAVLICYAGDEKGEITYLKNHGKKK